MLAAMAVAFLLICFFLVQPTLSLGQGLLGLAAIIVILYVVNQLLQRVQLSFSLSFMHLQHHSFRGGWALKWRNIEAIGIPHLHRQGLGEPLPWVGIKIKRYDALLDSISLRMVTHIIMTQRALLITAYRRGDHKPSKPLEDMMFDDTPYRGSNGVLYKGLMAMLANRMRYTRELLGYDLFVSEDLLDRPLEDFVGVARRYLAAASGDD
ncbi:DUF2982 domain-containing protein [Salinivibrio sp. VYel9]|nr:DUF2982 domain-containing protein [Salinivibrio sp. VYel7]MPX92909.1 DUF2982 domain-containing protein [Salinivibrio sp. VYel9]MPX95407.1 DUF2982 domain-containing protein [Salinivibrio sp. VYel6]MPX99127.1 DUF2982 domain-containing protein [Salinivibrio sp. VYel4]MPY02166.1 DUF2982 domain-containing protein [Salinivibrio sp. VYel5]MPY05095.1 DUF2982 domain-containing protein [Salinivibrio sp. VYel8]MPY12685.1 DUF2982 domain-containing protein [Salinivibrio sp. VGrn1]